MSISNKKKTIRVAIFPFRTRKTPKENLEVILHGIRQAKQNKVDVVCFPGATFEHWKNTNPREHLKIIRQKCKKYKMWAALNTYFESKRQWYNRTFLIDYSGAIACFYDKIHLWGREAYEMKGGKRLATANTPFGKITLATCWDIAFPEEFKKTKMADIILAPVYMVDYKKDGHVIRLIPQVRAFENLSYFIMCDAVEKRVLGESRIVSPLKNLKTIRRKEGLHYEDLDLAELQTLREYYGKKENR